MLTMVVFELIEEALGAVVEEVDAPIVERGQNPRPVLVEGQALHALALRLELSLHHLAALVIPLISLVLYCFYLLGKQT